MQVCFGLALDQKHFGHEQVVEMRQAGKKIRLKKT